MPAVALPRNSLADPRPPAWQDARVPASTFTTLLFPNCFLCVPDRASRLATGRVPCPAPFCCVGIAEFASELLFLISLLSQSLPPPSASGGLSCALCPSGVRADGSSHGPGPPGLLCLSSTTPLSSYSGSLLIQSLQHARHCAGDGTTGVHEKRPCLFFT